MSNDVNQVMMLPAGFVSGGAISSMGISAPPPVEITPMPASQPSPHVYQETVHVSVNTLPEFSVRALDLSHHMLECVTERHVVPSTNRGCNSEFQRHRINSRCFTALKQPPATSYTFQPDEKFFLFCFGFFFGEGEVYTSAVKEHIIQQLGKHASMVTAVSCSHVFTVGFPIALPLRSCKSVFTWSDICGNSLIWGDERNLLCICCVCICIYRCIKPLYSGTFGQIRFSLT